MKKLEINKSAMAKLHLYDSVILSPFGPVISKFTYDVYHSDVYVQVCTGIADRLLSYMSYRECKFLERKFHVCNGSARYGNPHYGQIRTRE